MKIIVPISILLISLIVAGVWSYQGIETTAKELLSHLNSIETSVKSERWREAEAAMLGLQGRWERVKGLWSTLLNHQEIDNIELSLSRLDSLIASKNTALIPPEVAALRLFIRHIPEKEAFTLRNIF